MKLEDENIEGSFLEVHLEYTELPLLDLSNETEYETFEKNFLDKIDDGPPEDGKLVIHKNIAQPLCRKTPHSLSICHFWRAFEKK